MVYIMGALHTKSTSMSPSFHPPLPKLHRVMCCVYCEHRRSTPALIPHERYTFHLLVLRLILSAQPLTQYHIGLNTMSRDIDKPLVILILGITYIRNRGFKS